MFINKLTCYLFPFHLVRDKAVFTCKKLNSGIKAKWIQTGGHFVLYKQQEDYNILTLEQKTKF